MGFEDHNAVVEEADAPTSTQAKLVLEYLQAGRTLTNMVALTCLGVGSLSSRIAELRKAGTLIHDEWAEDRFGRRYKKYFLDPSKVEDVA